MKLEELKKMKPRHVRLEKEGEVRSEIEKIMRAALAELEKEEIDALAPPNRKVFPHNYENPWNQACYIARYSYAYAREYTNLYLNMIDMGLMPDGINIISLGCGNMIDLWGLQKAMQFTKDSSNVKYIGVDCNLWGKKYIPSVAYDITQVHDEAGRFLSQNDELDYDVFIFPKSIGDISRKSPDDFEKVKDAFREGILKESFFVAFSIVQYDDQMEVVKDLNYANEVIKCFIDRGYETKALRRNNSPSAIMYRELPELPESLKEMTERFTEKKPITDRRYDRWKIYRISKEMNT